MIQQPNLSIIVFAFNEAENIHAVLTELITFLQNSIPSSEIIFVDDGSTDETFENAKVALVDFPSVILRHETNLGIGAALKTEVKAARGTWVTFMPADGQIEPQAIQTLLNANDNVDVVLSVYDHRDDGLDRKILSWGVRTLILVVHGVRLRSDGPYLFRRTLFDPSQLKPDTFFLNFEFPIRVLRAQLSTKTVTISCRPRLAGHSKSTGLKRVMGVAKDLAAMRLRRIVTSFSHFTGGPLDH